MLDAEDVIDPELASLYAAERAAPLPDGATARVLAGVLAGIAARTDAVASAAAAKATAAATAGGWSAKAVAAIAVASAIGGGAVGVIGYRALGPAKAPVQQPAPAPEPASPPEPAGARVDAGGPALAPAPVAPPEAPRRVPRPDALPADDTREPLLIDRARTALRRGLVDEALATLMRHERLHASGALAEERDVLLIEAYLAKGEPALARRRIARYRRDHPSGFLRARVERAEALLAP